jgi:hypothetical protein
VGEVETLVTLHLRRGRNACAEEASYAPSAEHERHPMINGRAKKRRFVAWHTFCFFVCIDSNCL